MTQASPRHTLIVANRTSATPSLIKEVQRRARERPTRFALLIPDPGSTRYPDWTLERATEILAEAAGGPVDSLMGGGDAFNSIRDALDNGTFDDVLISTLPKRRSSWLRRDLPHRVERLGVPVTVITHTTDYGDEAEALAKAGTTS